MASAMTAAHALRQVHAEGGFPEVVDVVPAARTVLIRVRPGSDLAAVCARARHTVAQEPPTQESGTSPAVTIPVRYHGLDLAEVAEYTGLAIDEVLAVHTGTLWTCAFTGFAPGFGYLTCPDSRLRVPRRAQPRTRVPAGSVALAGEFSGIYPTASPGGWQIIGHTSIPTWDLTRTPPALLTPGTTVRFEAVK